MQTKLPERYKRGVGIAPGYRDLFGEERSLDDLIRLLKQLPLREWMSFLSRAQTLIAMPNLDAAKKNKAIAEGILSRAYRSRLVDWMRAHQEATIAVVTESQVSTLQQLVITHAPQNSNRRIDTEADFDLLADALLITWDLMLPADAERAGHEVLSTMIQSHARMSWGLMPELVARAFFLYQLDREHPSAAVAQIIDLFMKAAGADLRRYLLGGLAVAIREYDKDVTDVAGGWKPTSLPEQCENPRETECLAAFHSIRAADVSTVRAEIVRRDGKSRISEFSLIGMLRYPIVDVPDVGRFVTSLTSLSHALFGGVYHAILTPTSERKIPAMNVQRLAGLFGEVFEEYVLDILQAVFGDRYIRVPTGERKRADALITYENRIVVIEIKGTHYQGLQHRGRLSLSDREAEHRDLRLTDGALQIVQTIEDLRNFKLTPNGLPHYDWTTTQITPVIVTMERLPLIWKLWPMYERLTAPIQTLPMRGQITPVRFLSVNDVERLPDLAQRLDFGTELARWAHEPDCFERPLSDYLDHAGHEFGQSTLLASRFATAMKALASQIGFDPSALDTSSEAS